MRHLDPRKPSLVRVWCPRKLYVSVYVSWLLLSFKGFYDMHTQAVSVSYRHAKRCVHYVHVYANSDRRIFLTRKRRHACMSYIRMKSVLLIWTSSLNDRSKLKGQDTDVKSGCGTSEGWSDLALFCDFRKATRFCRSGIFLGGQFQKIGEFTRGASLHFQKIAGSLKMNIFLKIFRILPYISKNNRQK